MAIRITQQYMYSSMLNGMQSSLGKYMESMEQGSTQKQINRPSDDPAAFYRILTTRDSIDETKKYLTNINEAKGWLELTDSTLTNLTTLMGSIKALMNQASTDCTAAERQIMADEAWQMFGQILNLSNTEFNGNQLFAGHKYNESAFEKGLSISVSMMDDTKPGDEDYETSAKKAWTDLISAGHVSVSGNSDKAIAVQFLEKGTLNENGFLVDPGTDDEGNPYDTNGDGALSFRWSSDGGKTWQTGSLPAGSDKITVGSGVEIDFSGMILGESLDISPAENTGEGEFSTEDGTTFFVKPTGIYQGDTGNPPPQITISNTTPGSTGAEGLEVEAEGSFGSNVLVRFDGVKQPDGTIGGNIPLTGNEEFAYSYSTDNGTTWVTAYAKSTGQQPLRLPVPGGYIDVDATNANNGDTIEAGTQVLIHPRRADLGYEVLKDTYIDVNRVGTEIFGGYYDNKPTLSDDTNLFNIMGDFIAALEFNNQEGCQEAYSKLSTCLEYVTTQTSRTGALENRVSLAYDVNTSTLLSQEEVLSGTEDIDLTELLSKLTQQQTTYQTVLMSSSMIMNMGLMNYL